MHTSIRKVSLKSAQYLPICSAFIATIIAGMLCLLDNIYPRYDAATIKVIYECIVATAGFFVIFCWSWYVGFCWSQIIGIIYTYTFFLGLWFYRYASDDLPVLKEHAFHVHLSLFTIGLIYCIYVIRKRCCR